jgi:hypothetical protein
MSSVRRRLGVGQLLRFEVLVRPLKDARVYACEWPPRFKFLLV